MDLRPMQALVRFGLGRRVTEPLLAGDSREWARNQLHLSAPSPSPSLTEALAALRSDREEKRPPGKGRSRSLFVRDAEAHLTAALTTPTPFESGWCGSGQPGLLCPGRCPRGGRSHRWPRHPARLARARLQPLGPPREEEGEGFTELATAAGEMLARPGGPRVAALELDGWDTHAAQPARLAAMLRQLDAGLAAVRGALGPVWRDSAILCMTEFGRTVRVNGTRGTDHGTGSVALLLGGGVAGGQVRADWPGPGRAGCSRTATSHQPPICAPSPRTC